MGAVLKVLGSFCGYAPPDEGCNSYVVRAGGASPVFLEFGSGAMSQLQLLTSVSAPLQIVISSESYMHWSDLELLLTTRLHLGVQNSRVTVVCPSSLIAEFDNEYGDVADFIEFERHETYSLGEMSIEPVCLDSSDIVGLTVVSDGAILLCGSAPLVDTGIAQMSSISALLFWVGADVGAAHEISMGLDGDLDVVRGIAEQCQPKSVVIGHLSPRSQIDEATLARAFGGYSGHVFLARRGLEVFFG